MCHVITVVIEPLRFTRNFNKIKKIYKLQKSTGTVSYTHLDVYKRQVRRQLDLLPDWLRK